MDKTKKTIGTIFWTLNLVKSLSPRLFFALIFIQVISTLLPLWEQKNLSTLIDQLNNFIQNKYSAWITAFSLFIISRLIKIISYGFWHYLSRIEDIRLRNELHKFYINHTSAFDYQHYENKEVASLIAKVREEYDWRIPQVYNNITDLITQIINLIAVVFIFFPSRWYLLVILFIGEIPNLIVNQKFQKINWNIFNKHSEINRPSWDSLYQLSDKKFVAELKTNQATSWLKDKAFAVFNNFTNVRVNTRKNQFFINQLSNLFSISAGVITMYFIIQEIINGQTTIGMFSFYFSIIRNTGDYFGSIFSQFVNIGEQVLHINNFRQLIDTKPIIVSGKIKTGLTQPPLIEFKNLSFKYPNTDKYIFKNLNLTIKPSEEIAIVGQNGAGKSTLIKLLCRFYDPTEGQILINGIDLKDYDLNYWYQNIGLLTQEFNTYPNLTLKENVTISHPQTQSNKKVIESLKMAEAYEFVKKYKNGIDTMMSQRYDGEEPSWGQWQKIAIARIFYKDSPIMILDEPTASIDAIAESKIFSRLFQQSTNKTIITVSHRFSTVRNAQRIIVIDQGKIVEQGSHEELITLNGLYTKSFNLQAKGYQK